MGFYANIICALSMLFFSSPAFAELAVIPYVVDTTAAAPSSDVSKTAIEDLDTEYAKLLGIAISLEMGKELYNPYQLSRDLATSGIDAKGVLTSDELQFLARHRMLSHIISGTLYKIPGGYRAKSFVYKASNNQIVERSNVSADTLFKLAQKDAAQLFRYDVQSHKDAFQQLDIVLLYDSSYNMSNEIDELKAVSTHIFARAFRDWPGSRLYLVPFSSAASFDNTQPITTALALEKRMDSLKLAGRGGSKELARGIRHLSENIRLRRGSRRVAFCISNSPLTESSAELSKYIQRAAAKKIAIHFILGERAAASFAAYDSLAVGSRGTSSQLLYHQALTDHNLATFHVFSYKGRLYYSEKEYPEWKSSFSPGSMKQLFVSEKQASAYALERYYRDSLKKTVSHKGRLETNLSYQLEQQYAALLQSGGASVGQKSVARVMFTTPGAAIWSDVSDYETLNHFKKYQREGASLLLGVRLIKDPASKFGYSFNSQSYVTGYSIDYIPRMMLVDPVDMLQSPYKYSEEGLLDPPLWFINVKVEQLVLTQPSHDLRSN